MNPPPPYPLSFVLKGQDGSAPAEAEKHRASAAAGVGIDGEVETNADAPAAAAAETMSADDLERIQSSQVRVALTTLLYSGGLRTPSVSSCVR